MKRRTEGVKRVPARQGLIEAAAIAAQTCDLTEDQAAVLTLLAESEHLSDHCLAISQEVIAKELGIARTTVGRIIRDLDRRRLVHAPEHGTRRRAQVYFTELHKWVPTHLTTMKSMNDEAVVVIGSGSGSASARDRDRDRVREQSSPNGDNSVSTGSPRWTSSPGVFQGGADGYRLLTNRKKNHCTWCKTPLDRGQGYLAKPLATWVVLCEDHAFDGHLVELSVFGINEFADFCRSCGEEIPALDGFMERANLMEAAQTKSRWLIFCAGCSHLPVESRRLLAQRRQHYLAPLYLDQRRREEGRP